MCHLLNYCSSRCKTLKELHVSVCFKKLGGNLWCSALEGGQTVASRKPLLQIQQGRKTSVIIWARLLSNNRGWFSGIFCFPSCGVGIVPKNDQRQTMRQRSDCGLNFGELEFFPCNKVFLKGKLYNEFQIHLIQKKHLINRSGFFFL